ncbi:MAG TPA: nucleotide exchange factor GrpE [Marmoricola sp.]|nr:nucleotide exchange factor GrpE [Marmoricola sp.]
MTSPEEKATFGDPTAGEQPTTSAAPSGDDASASGPDVEPGVGPTTERAAETAAGDPADQAGDPAAADGAEGPDATAQLRQSLSERTVDLQRLQAEYVNYKRRVERDRELVRDNATYAVLSALLPVLDDIDRAEEHGELTGGFKAVAQSLVTVVTGLGLTKYGEKGDEFDPNVHEALMHGHSPEVTTTTVDVVAQPGYRVGDRVVRVAKVTVLDPES